MPDSKTNFSLTLSNLPNLIEPQLPVRIKWDDAGKALKPVAGVKKEIIQ
jgi:hypothetical protein